MKNIVRLTFLFFAFLFSCSDSQVINYESPSQVQLDGIIYGLKDKSLTIIESCAIKSNDFAQIYFVGTKMSNGIICVWGVAGSKESPNLYFCVNDEAKELSDFPRDNRIKPTNHGIKEVIDYFKHEKQ